MPGTSQNSAFRWLVDLDGAQVCPENEIDVIQRYVMAVLYYSLGGDSWTKCSAEPSSACEAGERYLSPANACQWFNVTCADDGNIVEVILGMCYIEPAHEVPKSILYSHLSSFSTADNNNLIGVVPSELSALLELKAIELPDNSLIGAFPATLCEAENLERIELRRNNLEGMLPSCIGELDSLEVIALEENSIAGLIPSDLGDLMNLDKLFLHFNDFTGTMPAEICALRTGGQLSQLTADCGRSEKIECQFPECCTACF